MAKKENDATYILNTKKGLPNKLLQADGTVTDIQGNVVVNADEAWNAKLALPNKWLNPDGTYSTLNEIIASMVDTSIYVIVDELPQEGNIQKIYLVPDGKGGFIEYHWTGTKWDPIGMIEFDISNYSTTQEMMNAIEAAGVLTLNSAKTYADGKASTAETNAKSYTDTELTDYVKNTDYANNNKGGVIKVGSAYNLYLVEGVLKALLNDYNTYLARDRDAFISKGTLENVITGKELVNKTYVDNIVGDIENILEELDIGGGVE